MPIPAVLGALAARGVGGSIAARLFQSGAASAWTQIKKQVPTLEDEVTVEVRGQPGAVKKQLYYLALSTAFGLIRRFDIGVGRFMPTTPAGVLMCEYDAADNWVRATVKFKTPLISASLFTGLVTTGPLQLTQLLGETASAQVQSYLNDTNNVLNSVNLYSQAVVYSGPKDEVVGGPFNFTGLLTPGLPSTNQSFGSPNLPFKGQVVLTTQPTVNQGGRTVDTPDPKPPGDNRSRGAVVQRVTPATALNPLDGTDGFQGSPDWNRLLIPLVFACLTDPGSEADQVFPPPVPGPTGG